MTIKLAITLDQNFFNVSKSENNICKGNNSIPCEKADVITPTEIYYILKTLQHEGTYLSQYRNNQRFNTLYIR